MPERIISDRRRSRRLFDEARDFEAIANGGADLHITVAGLGPRRRNPDDHNRLLIRRQRDRRFKRRAISGERLDVMISRHRRDDRAIAQPRRNHRAAIDDRDGGAASFRLDDQIGFGD